MREIGILQQVWQISLPPWPDCTRWAILLGPTLVLYARCVAAQLAMMLKRVTKQQFTWHALTPIAALASTTCWPRPLMVIRAAVQSFQSHATQTNVASRYRFSISRETLRQVNLSHYCGLRWIAMLSRGLPAFRPVRHRVAETSIPHLPTRLLRAWGCQRACFIAGVVGHRSAWRAKQKTTRASLARNIARKSLRLMSS